MLIFRLIGGEMPRCYRYSATKLIAILCFAMQSTVFAATAYATPENAADTSGQNVIASIAQHPQYLVQTDSQGSDSLYSRRQAVDTGGSRLALVKAGASPQGAEMSSSVLSWETGAGKSFLIPAVEVTGSVVLLNVFDRLAFPNKMKEGRRAYNANLSTTWDHLRKQDWHFDRDTFEVNQIGHPYQGATMYGLARSSGLSFWQSFGYSHAGSFLWEMAGETSRPSVNDLITTGNAGSLLGEALFRMAGLVLEEGGDQPAVKYELAAALISPPTGFNRLAFGDRFKSVFPSHKPATFWQFMLGANLDVHATDLSPEASDNNANLITDFSLAYGLPGKPGYSYRRPLDYFDFQLALRTRFSNPMEALTLRGLLFGTDYHIGEDYRGIWGLYGSYDFIAPHLYRISSTAVSLGTTAQYWIAPGIALQGSVLGGVGFGAAGTETNADNDETKERTYHFGATPQGLVALTLLFGNRAMLEIAGRGFYHSGSSIDQVVLRGNAGLTIRVAGNHGVAVRYIESLRDTKNSNEPTRHLSEGTVSLVYTYLSDRNFGAVEWRNTAR